MYGINFSNCEFTTKLEVLFIDSLGLSDLVITSSIPSFVTYVAVKLNVPAVPLFASKLNVKWQKW
jgi:hypothetical protein